MTCDTIRQAILTRQRHELTGIGLVQTMLDREAGREVRSDMSAARVSSIDVTLARLSRLNPDRDAVELDYPWGTSDGTAGVLLGFIPEHCVRIETWQEDDAA